MVIRFLLLLMKDRFNMVKPKPIPACDYYYDMGYDYAFSRFYVLPPGT